jgi:hypothetical protein
MPETRHAAPDPGPLKHVTVLGEVAVYPDDDAAERGCWLQMPIEHCIPQEGWR